MAFLNFLKRKGKEEKWKRELEIPVAPPSTEELPEFPSLSGVSKKPKIEDFEEAAVKEERKELHEREQLEPKKPVFVSLNMYVDMIDEIGLAHSTLKESEDILVRISEFKSDEEKEFSKWENLVKDIQKKLIYADRALFGK